MNILLKLAASVAILSGVSACGEERGADGLTSDERQKLDEHAARIDNEFIDTSADSLVANGGDEWTAAESGEAVQDGNSATPAPVGNGQ